eukprot:1127842-Amphidinium_carterae.2
MLAWKARQQRCSPQQVPDTKKSQDAKQPKQLRLTPGPTSTSTPPYVPPSSACRPWGAICGYNPKTVQNFNLADAQQVPYSGS